jgi:hypothetical protein
MRGRHAVGLTGLVLLGLAACTTGDKTPAAREPDLSTLRAAAWSKTAEEISGDPDAWMGSIGGFQTVDSVTSGGLVVSAVDSRKKLTVVGIRAKTGTIAWKRVLPVEVDGYTACEDDGGGPLVVCSVSGPDPDAKTKELTVIDDRTGKIRKTLQIGATESFGIRGDQLYLTSFVPDDKSKRLDVTIERRSCSSGKVAWREKTAFAIEGWGHDGGQGFDIGARRVAAYSASWQVVVDRRNGRLLARSEQGRYEESLPGGGWLVTDTGDGSNDIVTQTLFAPSGKPIAEDQEPTYYWSIHDDEELVTTGRHLRRQSDGHVVFRAPKGQQIAAVVESGGAVVAQPADNESEKRSLPFQVWDVESGKRRGTVDVPVEWSSASIGGGAGFLVAADRFDDKGEKPLPSVLYVVDTKKPGIAATIDLGWKIDSIAGTTVIHTPVGAAATGPTGVRGFVAGS